MFGRKSGRSKTQAAVQSASQASERTQANQEITFLMGDRKIAAKVRESKNDEGVASLLEIAIEAQLPIEHSCGGFGTCGTCRILIEAGGSELTERGELESEMATDRKFTENERLACQTTLNHQTRACALRIRIPASDKE